MSNRPIAMRVSERKRIALAAERASENVEELGRHHNALVERVDQLTAQAYREITELGGRVTRLQIAEAALEDVLDRLQVEVNQRHQLELARARRSRWQRFAEWAGSWLRPQPAYEMTPPFQVAQLYDEKRREIHHDVVVLPAAAHAIGSGLSRLAEPVACVMVANWLNDFGRAALWGATTTWTFSWTARG